MVEEYVVDGFLVLEDFYMKMNMRFFRDRTTVVEVIACSEANGLSNIAFHDGIFCDLQELNEDIDANLTNSVKKHIQIGANICTEKLYISLKLCGILDGENGTWHGKWYNTDFQTQAGEFCFENAIISAVNTRRAEEENIDKIFLPHLMPLGPLMPGVYEFIGAAIAGNGVVYCSHVKLELLPDGSLNGIVEEEYIHEVDTNIFYTNISA